MIGALSAALLVATACTDAEQVIDEGDGPPGSADAHDARASFHDVRSGHDGVRFDAGGATVSVAASPFSIEVTDPSGPVVASPPGGVYVVRNGAPQVARDATVHSAEPSGIELAVVFTDGSTGELTLGPDELGSVHLSLRAEDPAAVTEWGTTFTLAEDEAIYGLTERIVDDRDASEIHPVEEGSLDRRGEVVTMWVTPTMSGYAPFHQSSQRWGMLVEGTMPGVYDIGRTNADRMDVRYETSPGSGGGDWHLLLGSHPEMLTQYASLTGFPPVPPDAVFRHWRGRDEEPVGPTVEWHGVEMNASVATDLAEYERLGLEPGIYHFDRPWAVGAQGYGELRFDPVRFPDAAEMLAAMHEAGWEVQVWMAPWVLEEAGATAADRGWLAPRSDRALDLTDSDAVAWQQDRVVEFLEGPEGRWVNGLFLDRGDEPDVSSEASDVYADGRTGREIHNAYPLLYAEAYKAALDRARPEGEAWEIIRPAWAGTQAFALRWGGDTPSREGLTVPEVPNTGASTDLGLRSVLISMQRAAFMGTTYWGSDIGGYSPWADRELYARWIEVGAVSPLMRFHGQGGAPWRMTVGGPTTDPELSDIYVRYVRLHHALAPYLRGLAEEASSNGMPLVRPLVFTWPEEPGARDRWDEWTLGPDLLAAPVWRTGQRSRSLWVPPGRWVDLWVPQHVVEGPAEIEVDAPLAVLPLWVREDSPLQDVLVSRTGTG